MITFDQVSVRYDGRERPALHEVDLQVGEGDLCLVVGPTGSGKTTLLGAACGQVPHVTGGHLQGRVTVAGRDTRTHRPHDLADVVGVVGQVPSAGFVTGTVEEELAFTMEQLAVPPAAMRQRVEETLDLMGLADLRSRRLDQLSGGQQQRVAIGAVMTAHPRVLILDEPTSALDPTAAEDVLATIARLVADLGVTVLVAEHRLERIVQFADQVVELRTPAEHARHGTTVRSGTPQQVLADAAVAPPIVQLARLVGWTPPPLTIRDARRRAEPLRQQLAAATAAGPVGGEPPSRSRPRQSAGKTTPAEPALSAQDISVAYGRTTAVRDVSVTLEPGTVTGLMGRNGAGKTSLLWALQGSGSRSQGRVAVRGHDPAGVVPAARRQLVALVPQDPGDLVYDESVEAACRSADDGAELPAGSCHALLEDLVGEIDGADHPRDLSEGQRLGLVLAMQLLGQPAVLALDEPTRGLDYAAKGQLSRVLNRIAASGTAVLVSSHDVEFVTATCSRILVMAQGEVIADGPSAEVVTASPAFAPQVARILRPQPWLTVDAVRRALAQVPVSATAPWPAPTTVIRR